MNRLNRLEIAVEVMKTLLPYAMNDTYTKEVFVNGCFNIAEAMLAEEAKRKEEENKPKGDPEGWIEWNGGECPVNGNTVVQCKLRNGEGWHMRELYADNWDWGFGDFPSGSDIIAYRVIK